MSDPRTAVLASAARVIAAVVDNEPDRLSGNFAAGPRVLISNDGLKAAGLIGFGSRASRRYLFKMPQPRPGQPSSDAAVAALKTRLEGVLPEAQLTDYREASPAITSGLDAATGLLSLMSLVALVLGAVGVANAREEVCNWIGKIHRFPFISRSLSVD